MLTRSNFGKLLTASMVVVLVFISALVSFAQAPSDLKEFKILIEETDNGIKMISEEGTAWKELSFKFDKKKPHLIDAYGVTTLDEMPVREASVYADFQFTIVKEKDRIVLKSNEGTAWKELSFSFAKNGRQRINQFGTASVK
ncbi:hypothetical protein [Penaeicola halotolerans]|uniref:hypothetical protein n=1 Tax=Penaeicola halotolerans TaxID=2793196 RepID=UPI001CF92A8E|nr:hypothetical protein [Penaeicola halotolerans]